MLENKYTVFNIREYLKSENHGLGESELQSILSEFSCPGNSDAELLGHFAITVKPITVNSEPFSNTTRRKLARVSELNEQNRTYDLAAYLIAQLGKNYQNGANN